LTLTSTPEPPSPLGHRPPRMTTMGPAANRSGGPVSRRADPERLLAYSRTLFVWIQMLELDRTNAVSRRRMVLRLATNDRIWRSALCELTPWPHHTTRRRTRASFSCMEITRDRAHRRPVEHLNGERQHENALATLLQLSKIARRATSDSES